MHDPYIVYVKSVDVGLNLKIFDDMKKVIAQDGEA